MKNRTLYRFLALSTVIILGISNIKMSVLATESQSENQTAESEAENEKDAETEAADVSTYDIRISDVDDMLSLAESCKKGGYSQGLAVILDADIDMSGEADFTGIDSFSGIFNGNNHTVSGININTLSGSLGLFGYVEDNALIENLTVDGVIYSTDKNNHVGLVAGINAGTIKNCKAKGIVTATGAAAGIAGLNGGLGQIYDCTNKASVYSLTSVGGIAGENRGTISSCTNTGGINADSSWLSLEDSSVTTLSLDSIIDSFSSTVEVGSDIGGISGISLGTISDCVNNGVVGYQHAGKNIGGIVGRFCGTIAACTNNGKVYGKQDVGGIAGQFEPKLLEDGADMFDYIDELEDLTSKLIDDTSDATISGEDSLNKAADRIEEAGDKATDRIDEYSGRITDSITEQTNETKLRINKAADSIKGLQNELKNIDKDDIKDSNLTDLQDDTDIGNIDDITNIVNIGDLSDISSSASNYQQVLDSIASVSESIDTAQSALSKYNAANITDPIVETLDSDATTVYNDVKDVGNDLTEDITEATDDTSSDLRKLSDDIESSRDTLTSDFHAINNKISDITSLADEQVDNLKRLADGEDLYEDYSAIDYDNEEASRIKDCNNAGYVNGDRNVGGIAGSIAIDGTDVNDTDDNSSTNVTQQYITLAVLENSNSTGIIELRKENAGGIVGNSSLGFIKDCVAKNRIISEEGNYIGGVAGYVKGTVTDCNAISVLEGSNYVGGIAGAAKKLRNCYSLVDITEDSKWAGEIIGDVIDDSTGDVTVSHSNMMNFIFNNYYVSEEFGGINNVSYNGIAELISYDALLSNSGSDDFSKLNVYFYDSDYNLVSTDTANYGDSIASITFPSLTTEEDTYLVWDGVTTDKILGNMFLVAGDADDVTVLASDLKIDGKPVALAQGVYYESSSLEVKENTEIAAPEEAYGNSEVNIYSLKLINTAVDDSMESQVRFYIGDSKYARLYQYVDDKWTLKKNTKIAGSYVESSFTGDSAIFAVEKYDRDYSSIRVIIIGLLIVVLVIVLISIRKFGKDKKRTAKNQGL